MSVAVAVSVWFALRHRVRLPTQAIATWDAFAVSVLLLAWITIVTTPSQQIRKRAQAQDSSATLVFAFVLCAACAGLFAVVFLFHSSKGAPAPQLALHVALSAVAVLGSWSIVHTLFGLRYAHKFYGDGEDGAKSEPAGGLDFPGGNAPDYLDFAYFSFVIGMTFQVSDVEITSRTFRHMVLIHSVLSFGFNTFIVALAINTIARR